MKKRPTVVDVARLAGVGPSTVSRFLRGVNISKKASEKVERAIRQTGYEPDDAARALRSGRSSLLGVIVPKVSNAFFSSAVQTLEERAHEHGYSVLLLTHMDRLADQSTHLATLRRSRVDGVILTPAPGSTAAEVRRQLGETPIVAFDACFSPDIDTVVLQNRESARQATEHLFAHGYKRVAAITAKPAIYSFSERLAGYTDAMNARLFSPTLLATGDYDELRHLLRKVLTGRSRPDALITLSDFATLNLIRIYEELHLAPDQWVPLIGFDDFDYAPLLPRPVTVMRQPVDEMVRTALNVLIRRIGGEAPSSPGKAEMIQVPAELVRRRSCGCA